MKFLLVKKIPNYDYKTKLIYKALLLLLLIVNIRNINSISLSIFIIIRRLIIYIRKPKLL